MVHDLARWLPDRSIQVLHEWCSLELNTVVVDTVSLRSNTMISGK
ncbi:MAG TPA: hypothetical protein VE737_01700 [Actinomycetota bacterium]|nr:hypothetical protein [Actinomycetota bacterium]